jgi:hypothetical protein
MLWALILAVLVLEVVLPVPAGYLCNDFGMREFRLLQKQGNIHYVSCVIPNKFYAYLAIWDSKPNSQLADNRYRSVFILIITRFWVSIRNSFSTFKQLGDIALKCGTLVQNQYLYSVTSLFMFECHCTRLPSPLGSTNNCLTMTKIDFPPCRFNHIHSLPWPPLDIVKAEKVVSTDFK